MGAHNWPIIHAFWLSPTVFKALTAWQGHGHCMVRCIFHAGEGGGEDTNHIRPTIPPGFFDVAWARRIAHKISETKMPKFVISTPYAPMHNPRPEYIADEATRQWPGSANHRPSEARRFKRSPRCGPGPERGLGLEQQAAAPGPKFLHAPQHQGGAEEQSKTNAADPSITRLKRVFVIGLSVASPSPI
jgi:hypothetical protein